MDGMAPRTSVVVDGLRKTYGAVEAVRRFRQDPHPE
jgi:hypothetical protein